MKKQIMPTEAQIKIAFDKVDDIQNQLNTLVEKLPENSKFWGNNFSGEFNIEDCEKIGDIWKFQKMINGHTPHTAYSIWRTLPNYNGKRNGKTPEEIFLESEREKVLVKTNDFRISWVRKGLIPPTETYWGFRLSEPVFVLYDSFGKEICSDNKRWRFLKKAQGGYKQQDPTALYDLVRAHFNPFRVLAVKSSDVDSIKHLCKILNFYVDTPLTDTFHSITSREDCWVVFLFSGKISNSESNSTWFLVNSKEKPDLEKCMVCLAEIIKTYTGEWWEVLPRVISEMSDINSDRLHVVNRIIHVVNGKFSNRIEKIFNARSILKFCDFIENISKTTKQYESRI